MRRLVFPPGREGEADLELSEDSQDLCGLKVAGSEGVAVSQNTLNLLPHGRLFSAEETLAGHLPEPRENSPERRPGDAVLPDGLVLQQLRTNQLQVESVPGDQSEGVLRIPGE